MDTSSVCVDFLDQWPPERRGRLRAELREAQRRMTIPIGQGFSSRVGDAGLRGNVWDDLVETFGRFGTSLGRAVVAVEEDQLVGFCKAPIRLPIWLAAILREPIERRMRSDDPADENSTPVSNRRTQLWCANSLGVVPSHRSRGIGRQLLACSHSQFQRPVLIISGHEVGNVASEKVHLAQNYRFVARVRLFHLCWQVYAFKYIPPGRPEQESA